MVIQSPTTLHCFIHDSDPHDVSRELRWIRPLAMDYPETPEAWSSGSASISETNEIRKEIVVRTMSG